MQRQVARFMRVLPFDFNWKKIGAIVSIVISFATPLRASDFLDVIGVNIHLDQAGYSAADIVADMAYLGLTEVRNHGIGPLTPPYMIKDFDKLAAAGLKFDWLTGGPLPQSITALKTFVSLNPGSVTSIEGPNEVNNFPITYDSLTGTKAAVAYQAALNAAAKSDPALATIPVLDFTDYPGVAGAADAANGHPYPKGGAQPRATLAQTFKQLQILMKGDPVYLTETGYFSLPGRHGWEGVDEDTQAKLSLNLIMDAASVGVTKVFLYDLIDDGPDPKGTVAANHFGLFHANNTPKPAAKAIRALTAVLGDAGAPAPAFTPTPLSCFVRGLPATGASLVIEKSPGVYDLVLWAEPPIWDSATARPKAAPTENVTVDFAAAMKQVRVFDPMATASLVNTVQNTGTVTVSLSDHPIVVEVTTFTA